ncbi:MAG: RNA methyltransferase [Acidimicrobiales bacterium]
MAAALGASAAIEAIYVDEEHVARLSGLLDTASRSDVRIYILAAGVLERVADATSPQPVLATAALPVSDLKDIPCEGLILVLHDVRDPGNAGTLIRSGDATGAAGVVFSGHSVDPFNPKTLRATAGSIFHLPVAVAELDETLRSLSLRGAPSYATVVRGGQDHRSINYLHASVVVIGNEAEGLSEDAVALCDERISIAMTGAGESLNAGVAGSLIAFESMWQRQSTGEGPITPSL